ncbi:MAG: hypothetical protein AAGC55_03810 [Myxococcota bacterium]
MMIVVGLLSVPSCVSFSAEPSGSAGPAVGITHDMQKLRSEIEDLMVDESGELGIEIYENSCSLALVDTVTVAVAGAAEPPERARPFMLLYASAQRGPDASDVRHKVFAATEFRHDMARLVDRDNRTVGYARMAVRQDAPRQTPSQDGAGPDPDSPVCSIDKIELSSQLATACCISSRQLDDGRWTAATETCIRFELGPLLRS